MIKIFEQKEYRKNSFGRYYNSYIQDYTDVYITKTSTSKYQKKSIDDIINAFNTTDEDKGAYVENGIIRWKSNNSIPPQDIIEFWEFISDNNYFKLPYINFAKCYELRSVETQKHLDRYRKNHVMSDEEYAEMQNTFGADETVVNIITGKKYYT